MFNKFDSSNKSNNFNRNEECLLSKRIEDLLDYSEAKQVSRFTSFLTEKEQEVSKKTIYKSSANSRCIYFGGYDEAERKILGIFPNSVDLTDLFTAKFPVTAVTFTYSVFSEGEKLSHRDFLGAVMNCGIKREVIGDILTGKGYGIVLCLESVSALLFEEISKIGKVGVKPILGTVSKYPIPKTEFSIINDTVSSLRLDSIISVATGLSRAKSLDLINNGFVKIKGTEVYKSTNIIEETTSLTIKGYGKFLLYEIGCVSKKGRTHIKLKKYK